MEISLTQCNIKTTRRALIGCRFWRFSLVGPKFYRSDFRRKTSAEESEYRDVPFFPIRLWARSRKAHFCPIRAMGHGRPISCEISADETAGPPWTTPLSDTPWRATPRHDLIWVVTEIDISISARHCRVLLRPTFARVWPALGPDSTKQDATPKSDDVWSVCLRVAMMRTQTRQAPRLDRGDGVNKRHF